MDEYDLQALLDQQSGYVQPTYDYGSEPAFDLTYYQDLFSPSDYLINPNAIYSDGMGGQGFDLTSLINSGVLPISYGPGTISSKLSYLTGDLLPSSSMIDAYGGTIGVDENPLEYFTSSIYDPTGQGGEIEQVFIRNNTTGEVVGYVDEAGQPQYYAESGAQPPSILDKIGSALSKVGATDAQKSYRSQLGELLAKQALQQAQAKQNYQQSNVGQATAGLAMAAKLAQDLIGKNKGATTSRRANQGQAFSPTYIGASEPKTKYADGGKVESSPCRGGLLNVAERLMNAMMQEHERTGRKGLIQGEAGGQDDVVDIKAAPGEYIMDAEIVSALGDGNNEEGARKLDEMRMNVRKHKRKGGLTSIPPKSKRPEQYLNEEY